MHLYFLFGKFHLDIHNKIADNNGTALPHETYFDIIQDHFVELMYLSGDLKTISYHINLLDYYLRWRSVPPVSAIICRPDFPCSRHTPPPFISTAFLSLGKTSGPTMEAAGEVLPSRSCYVRSGVSASARRIGLAMNRFHTKQTKIFRPKNFCI